MSHILKLAVSLLNVECLQSIFKRLVKLRAFETSCVSGQGYCLVEIVREVTGKHGRGIAIAIAVEGPISL